MLAADIKKRILAAQKNEITEHIIYHRLSLALRDKEKAAVLEKISRDELTHHDFWRELTAQYVEPDRRKVFFFTWLSRIFGLTFGLKLMERGEDNAQDVYDQLREVASGVTKIIQDEEAHEKQLIDLINEERLLYVSSVVLGLNDALVELTGALVGFTFALQNTRLVGIVGLITGIAASMSMAASEYLATKQEDTKKSPAKAAVITGGAYVLTVALLILPYLVFENIFLCLGLVVGTALLVISSFTYYISVAKDMDFKKRFLEMAGISLGVAAINFAIGLAVRAWFGIDV